MTNPRKAETTEAQRWITATRARRVLALKLGRAVQQRRRAATKRDQYTTAIKA